MTIRPLALLCALLCSLSTLTAGEWPTPEPVWAPAMTTVNAKFEGSAGHIAQFGDSITYADGFWKPLGWSTVEDQLRPRPDDGFPKQAVTWTGEKRRWRDTLKGFTGKGPDFGNLSGWKVTDLLKAVPVVLTRDQPEAAIIGIGTNDTGPNGPHEGYRAGLEQVVTLCLEAHCIPILNTIAPKRGCDAGVEKTNAIIREVAAAFSVPLVDYHAEILKRRPGNAWDGTLVSKDGVHPSSGKNEVFDDENLAKSGYALRNFLNFMLVRELYFRVLSTPKPYIEKVGTVEAIRQGVRCSVVADTQVSKYKDSKDNEQLWNWGAAERLKCKGVEEYTLLKFDTGPARGLAVKRATLYLSRTEQCIIHVAGVSTISTDWAEGKGRGEPGKLPIGQQDRDSHGGATFLRAIHPDATWAGPDTTLKQAINGHGGSLWGAAQTGWAADDAGQRYYSVELPLPIAQSLLLEGDSYGLVVADEKGQRQYQKKLYPNTPNDNHYLNARESGKPCFLVIEGEPAPTRAPLPLAGGTARPGVEAGSLVLAWNTPSGEPLHGFRVHLAQGRLTAGDLSAKNLLPRHRTWRPAAPGTAQEFPLDGLQPGAEYTVAVVAYDRFGNAGAPLFLTGTARAARPLVAKRIEPAARTGGPLTAGQIRVWAAASNEKINPLTGNAMSEGGYAAAAEAGTYRNGNEAWDGRRRVITLQAGRNDFIGFQLAIENRGDQPLLGLDIAFPGLEPDAPGRAQDRLIRLSFSDPGRFQTAIEELLAQDQAAADQVLAEIKTLRALQAQQQSEPKAFVLAMKGLRESDPATYQRRMALLGSRTDGAAATGGIPASAVELCWQWNLRDDKAGTWYPDPLVPLSGPIEIPNSTNGVTGQRVQALYVDIWVPHGTAPGQYRGEIAIQAPGQSLSVPVELQVVGYTLPDTLSFVCEMNGYNYPAAKDWEGSLNLHRLAHRNRLNVNIVPYKHNGTWAVPQMELKTDGVGKAMRVTSFANFDTHFGPLLDGRAFARNPRSGVPVPAMFLGLFENWPCNLAGSFVFDKTARRLDLREDFSADYKDGFVAVSKQMAEHFKQKGFTRTALQVFLNNKYQYAPDKTFWLLDEPMFRDDFLVIQMFGDLVREGFKDAAPLRVDYRIDCSRVEEARGMLDAVDTFVFSQYNAREYPGIAQELMRSYRPRPASGARIGWEYGGAGAPSTGPESLRSWVVDSWLSGRDGLLPWLSYGTEKSWDSTKDADNAIFYPALEKWGYDGCYGSLRMKAFRDGQQDAETLNLLAAKRGATRREVREMLRPLATFVGAITTSAVVDELAPDAGSVRYNGVTPDTLVQIRRLAAQELGGGQE